METNQVDSEDVLRKHMEGKRSTVEMVADFDKQQIQTYEREHGQHRNDLRVWMDANYIDGRIAVQVFDDFYKYPSIAGNKKINTKALLIACDKDEIATLDSVEKLYQRFTNAEIKIIKNAGHLVVLERPGTIIRAWLK